MNLHEEIRRRRVNALVADAAFLRGQPDTDERADEMERERRTVMYELALGRITGAEKEAILEILKGENHADDPGTE